jgi:hypothetical protein
MNKKILIIGLLLGFLTIPYLAKATNLNLTVGETIEINCSATNITYNLTCSGMCENICEVDRTLSPNETYEFHEGMCDLNIFCESVINKTKGKVKFPGMITMSKGNGTVKLKIDIDDWIGNEYLKKEWNMEYSELYTVQYPFEFECPAEIKTDINLQNCLPYLSQAFNESSSLTYQISFLNQMCFEKLTECNAKVLKNDQIADDYIEKYNVLFNDWENEHAKLIDCEKQLNAGDPATTVGRLTKQVNDLNRDMRINYIPRKDYNTVFMIAIVLGVILIIIVFFSIFGGYR